MIQQRAIVLQDDDSLEAYLQDGWTYIAKIKRHDSSFVIPPIVILQKEVFNTINDIIRKGDKVCVEMTMTDGENTTTGHIIGIVTSSPEGIEPWMEIDGKEICLASEGHSSRVHKLKQ